MVTPKVAVMSKYCNFIIKGSIGDVLSYMVLLRDNDIPGIVLSNKAALSFSSHAMPPRMLTDSTHASKVIIRTSDFSMVEALAKDIELHVI